MSSNALGFDRQSPTIPLAGGTQNFSKVTNPPGAAARQG